MSLNTKLLKHIAENAMGYLIVTTLMFWLIVLEVSQPLLSQLNLPTSIEDGYVIIIFGSFVLSLVTAHPLLGLMTLSLPSPYKGTLYSCFADLTDRDILVASRRKVCLDGLCQPETANDYMNTAVKSNLKRKRILAIAFADVAIIILIAASHLNAALHGTPS